VGPIETYFVTLILVFGVVGWVRGFNRELGVTIPVLFAMYILARFSEQVFNLADRLYPFRGTANENLIVFNIVLFVMLFITLISYEGETLAFAGNPPPGILGTLLNIGAGLFNGYLIIGTIWYYLDELNYPIRQLGLFEPPLSDVARAIVELLPQNIPPEGRADEYFLALGVLLVILRVIR
jgi:uncharacterized membrane protein required for colicin V production